MIRKNVRKSITDTKPTGMISILKNPTTVKALAKQIVTASDDYIAMRIDEKEYRELVVYYAKYHGRKLFAYKNPGTINPTIQNRIGKKRLQLVELMLEGMQMSIN